MESYGFRPFLVGGSPHDRVLGAESVAKLFSTGHLTTLAKTGAPTIESRAKELGIRLEQCLLSHCNPVSTKPPQYYNFIAIKALWS
jgi:hypothetical protein